MRRIGQTHIKILERELKSQHFANNWSILRNFSSILKEFLNYSLTEPQSLNLVGDILDMANKLCLERKYFH